MHTAAETRPRDVWAFARTQVLRPRGLPPKTASWGETNQVLPGASPVYSSQRLRRLGTRKGRKTIDVVDL
jgi:hypothetical protein